MNILSIVNPVNLKAIKNGYYQYAVGTLIDMFTLFV